MAPAPLANELGRMHFEETLIVKLLTRTLLAAAALAGSMAAQADAGIFGSYVAIDKDGPGANAYVWYGAQQPGSNMLSAFNGLDIGSYTVGDQAYISGGEVLTFKNNGSDVTGALLNWRVDGGAFQAVNIGFTANAQFNDAAGNSFNGNGDQKWAELSLPDIDFLSGVDAGTHTLEIFFSASTANDGTLFSSNNGSNFVGHFAVEDAPPVGNVPEPASLALISLGLGTLAVARRRTKR